MAELKAPPGAFLILELERDLPMSRVAGIFHNVALVPGVHSCSDLATVPIAALEERVLLRLSPEELQVWLKAVKPPQPEGAKRGRKRAG